MTREYKKALAEIKIILEYMDKEYTDMIPKKFIDFIEKNKDSLYVPEISRDIPINEQPICKDTKILLSILYRVCWKEI